MNASADNNADLISSNDQRIERFISLCRNKGFSVTPQRLALYRALIETKSHPTPEMLYDSVRRTMPTISIATVYKAIETFKELEVIREIPVVEENRKRLDADLSHHQHMVCTSCRKVIDLRLDLCRELIIPEDAKQGFEVKDCSIVFKGICSECRNN